MFESRQHYNHGIGIIYKGFVAASAKNKYSEKLGPNGKDDQEMVNEEEQYNWDPNDKLNLFQPCPGTNIVHTPSIS
jgi:hypothetical protein